MTSTIFADSFKKTYSRLIDDFSVNSFNQTIFYVGDFDFEKFIKLVNVGMIIHWNNYMITTYFDGRLEGRDRYNIPCFFTHCGKVGYYEPVMHIPAIDWNIVKCRKNF